MGPSDFNEATGLFAAEELWIKIYFTLAVKVVGRDRQYIPLPTNYIVADFNIFFATYGGGNRVVQSDLSGHTWSERVLTKHKDFVNTAKKLCPKLIAEVDATRVSRSSDTVIEPQTEICNAYILYISTDMLHSVFDDPASLPYMYFPPSSRTDNEKQLDRFRAFQRDVPGFAEINHVERETCHRLALLQLT